MSLNPTKRIRYFLEGSGCGSVGRAVVSDTRDIRFESTYLAILFTVN